MNAQQTLTEHLYVHLVVIRPISWQSGQPGGGLPAPAVEHDRYVSPGGCGRPAAIPVRLLAFLAAAALAGLAACSAAGPAGSGRAARPARPARPGHAGHDRPRLAARHTAGVPVDPAYFSREACELFPPLRGNRDLTVFLDAGHGGPDPGAVVVTSSGRVIVEARQTLAVVLDAMALLRDGGFTVVVSRTGAGPVARLGPGDMSGHLLTADGVRDDVAARDVCANRARASVLIGVYFNSGAPGPAVRRGQPAPGWLGAVGRARRDEPAGLADPGRRGSLRHHTGLRGDRGRRRLRSPDTARPGQARLLHYPEPDAGDAHRAAVHHRPVRGLDRRQRARAAGDRDRAGPRRWAILRHCRSCMIVAGWDGGRRGAGRDANTARCPRASGLAG